MTTNYYSICCCQTIWITLTFMIIQTLTHMCTHINMHTHSMDTHQWVNT